MEIFKLFGSVFVKTEEAEKSLSKVEEKGTKTASNLNEVTGKVNKFALKVGAGVLAAGTGLMALASKTAETADEIDKMSERTGISRERLQELKYAAGQCGVEFTAIESGVKTLTKNMGKADDESKRMVDAFGDLGVAIKDANGNIKQSPDLFEESVKKLADMEDQTQRNILGQKIFGGSWNEMIPLINQGSEGIKALTDRSRELGLVMDEDTIKANVAFGDAMDDAKQALGAIFVNLANKLLPYLQKFLDWVLANMPTIQAVAGGVLGGLAEVIGFVADNANWLIPILGGVLAGIVALNVLNGINNLMTMWSTITAGATTAQAAFNAVLAANPIIFIALAIGAVIAALLLLWNNCEGFREFVTEAFTGIVGGITLAVDAIISAWNSIPDVFNSVVDWIKGKWDSFCETVGGAWDTVTGGISSAFTNVKNTVIGVMQGIVNTVIRGINFCIDALNNLSFDIPSWVPGIGGSHFGLDLNTINEVSWLYKGGIVNEPTILGGIGVGDEYKGQGNQSEVVIPLDKLYELIEKIADRVIQVNVDGREIARAVAPFQDELEEFNSSKYGFAR